MIRILLLSGPNLDLLGTREPHVYGAITLDDHVAAAVEAMREEAQIEHVQSANESHLVGEIHRARGAFDAIVINAGALTHYGWALHDALAAFDGVVVEVHISNVSQRERWRHLSVIAPVADASLQGLGRHAYAVGCEVAARLVADRVG